MSQLNKLKGKDFFLKKSPINIGCPKEIYAEQHVTEWE